jgi:hypothetical protein
MDVLETLNELDGLFSEYVNLNHIVKDKFKLTDNDVRISFYKLSYHVIDATIHLIMFSGYGYGGSQILDLFNEKNRIRNRIKRYPNTENFLEEGYYNVYRFIAYGYFISIFNLFENSFRILSQIYDPKEYLDKKNSFRRILDHFIKQFKDKSMSLNKINTDYFGFVLLLRNSIHNNGRYVAMDKHYSPKSVIDFDGNSITFKHNQTISVEDVWENNIKMTKRLSEIYNELILLPKFSSESFIEDPSVL